MPRVPAPMQAASGGHNGSRAHPGPEFGQAALGGTQAQGPWPKTLRATVPILQRVRHDQTASGLCSGTAFLSQMMRYRSRGLKDEPGRGKEGNAQASEESDGKRSCP